MPPPTGRFCALYHRFLSWRSDFAITGKVLRKFQGSAIFGSWDMTLFTRSCHDPNGWFTLFCAGSVFDTQLMPYCVNSTSLVSKSVIRRYNGQFQGQGQLRTISCYFDLMSNFQLDPRSKSICFDASWRKKHDGACIIPLDFLVLKLFAKSDTSSNRYLSFFDPTWGDQDMI